MELRLCTENSVESLGLLQSVVKKLKTMKKYIADTESTHVDADSVRNFTQSSSIPSEEEEANEDCHDFELLIPSFFFYEEGDLSDEMNFQTRKVRGTLDSCEKFQSLNDLVINHNKLIGKNCSPILSDYSRILFDRGKGLVVIGRYPCCVRSIYKFYFDLVTSFSVVFNGLIILRVDYDKKLASKMINDYGYQSYWLFSESMVGMSAEGGISSIAWHAFGKLLQRVISHQIAGEHSSYIGDNLTGSVFDLGRRIEHMGRYSCFDDDYECYFVTITSCVFVSIESISILMVESNVNCVSELDLRLGYQSESLLMFSVLCLLDPYGDSGVDGKLLLKMSHGDSVTETLSTLQ
ncbi:uncharacterized protein LOC113301450 [Papaver somniferum]|uniref:uncharacterized protein LOC113301450 n=1 Tax=Papaver somniferum TaxID=3469 RepID=UPI000E7001F0|nr:uncharacterized protein LOC113301450 [Papaver somniferum]